MSRKSKAAEFVAEGYNITVTGRNVQVTDSLRDYAIEKVSKIERFTDRIIDVLIVMDIQKLEQRVDISLKLNNVKIKSQASSENLYTAIDMAVHKLETQFLKYKNRLQDHHAKNLAAVDMVVNVFSQDEGFNEEIDEQNTHNFVNSFKPAKIIDKEKRQLRTLNVDEAIMKMELSSDRFLIFRSEEDRKLKVIYRRDDGNFGVIEIEA